MIKINTKLVISELHKAFNYINRDYFEGKLPEPAILIQSRGNKKLTLGWCSVNKIWVNGATNVEKYEINIVAEALNRGMIPVLTTLFHEMVHLHNLENGIKDTTRGNTYHNKNFKIEAEKRGLLIQHDDKIGYSPTQMLPATVERMYTYGILEEAFLLGRKDTSGGDEEKKKKKSSSRKYICPECGMTIRASKDVLVLCGLCTDIENQKAVVMVKEASEDDEPSTPVNEVECCCRDCGVIFVGDEESVLCPECGGMNLHRMDEEEPVDEDEEPVEIEPTPNEVEEPVVIIDDEPELPEGLDVVDTKLGDGAGNMVDVEQVVIKIPTGEESVLEKEWSKTENTGWDEKRIREVMDGLGKFLEGSEGKTVDISETTFKVRKMKSSYANWAYAFKKTRGRGADKMISESFTFSKNLLENYTDSDIVDVIKHEYIHCWVNCVSQKDHNHNDVFKRYCKKVGAPEGATLDLKPIR